MTTLLSSEVVAPVSRIRVREIRDTACKACHAYDLHRCRRETLVSFWLSIIGYWQCRCDRCGVYSFYLLSPDQLVNRLSWVALLAAGIVFEGVRVYTAHNVALRVASAPMAARIEPSSFSGRGVRGPQGLPEAPPLILTNKDVLSLTGAGFSPKLVSTVVQISDGGFDYQPQALIELKRGGVDENVIGVILDRRRKTLPTLP